jgi:hypothetical protein
MEVVQGQSGQSMQQHFEDNRRRERADQEENRFEGKYLENSQTPLK